MKKLLLLITALTIPAFLGCSTSENITGNIDETHTGVVSSANITLNDTTFGVGDSIKAGVNYNTTEEIDLSKLNYYWEVLQDGIILDTYYEIDALTFIPQNPGIYQFNLELEYENDTTSTTVFIVVIEKEIIIDGSNNQLYTQYTKQLPGSYIGTVTTPWEGAEEIVFQIDEKGSYSAYNYKTDRVPAFYYGFDEDHNSKKMKLTDITASDEGLGEITLYYGYGSTTTDEVRHFHFNSTNDSLFFEVWRDGKYGPLEVALKRTDAEKLPPRPLPTPTIELVGENDIDYMNGYRDSVVVTLAVEGDYAMAYQIVENPNEEDSFSYIDDPELLWSDSNETFTYSDAFTLYPEQTNSFILCRATAPGKIGGVNLMPVWISNSSK